MENVIKRISHNRIICFLSGALIALAVVFVVKFVLKLHQRQPLTFPDTWYCSCWHRSLIDKNITS